MWSNLLPPVSQLPDLSVNPQLHCADIPGSRTSQKRRQYQPRSATHPSRTLTRQAEALSDEEIDLEQRAHDVRAHGYGFLVPIGRLNTQEDEIDDTLAHDEGSPQPQSGSQHPRVGAAAQEAGIDLPANTAARDPLPQPPTHAAATRRNQPPPPVVAADPVERDLDEDISDASNRDITNSDDETVDGSGEAGTDPETE